MFSSVYRTVGQCQCAKKDRERRKHSNPHFRDKNNTYACRHKTCKIYELEMIYENDFTVTQ